MHRLRRLVHKSTPPHTSRARQTPRERLVSLLCVQQGDDVTQATKTSPRRAPAQRQPEVRESVTTR